MDDAESQLLARLVIDQIPNQHWVQIIKLVAEGRTDREIAAALAAKEGGIKDSLKQIYRALEARNRTHAVSLAYERGWIRAKCSEVDPRFIHVLIGNLQSATRTAVLKTREQFERE